MFGNHSRSLVHALAIVVDAADAGAYAIKLNTYATVTIKIALKTAEFFISDPNSL